MKIAYINISSGVFGGVRILTEHLNRLADRGHECWYLTLEDSPLTWLATRFHQAWIKSVPIPLDRFDVVVATASGTWPLVAENAAFGRAKRKVFVQMMEHLFYPPSDPAHAETVKYYQLPLEPIVISQWLYDEIRRFNPRPVHLVPNGIDTRLFYPDPLSGAKPRLRLLVEGYSHNPAKDIEEMAHYAIRALKLAGYDVEVWGFSQYAPRWEFDRYWIQPSQDLIRRIYSSCDILVKATRFEGRPGPDPEAMACGAVVCRAIDKGDDDLQDGVNCLKTAYGDHEGFFRNLRRLADDPDLRARLSANGLSYVRKNMDWNKIIPKLERALAA